MKLPVLLTCLGILITTTKAQGATKILVIGGLTEDDGATNLVEVLDLEDPNDNCVNPAPMPESLSGPDAQLVAGNQLLVCGGAFTSACNMYDFSEGIWLPAPSMTIERFDPESLLLGDERNGQVYLMAGGKPDNDNWLDSTERLLLSDGNGAEWVENPNLVLPEGLHHSCLLQVNSTLAMLIGGASAEEGQNDEVYFLDLRSMEFIPGPSMAVPKAGQGCGLIVDPSTGETEVVSQFATTTEIFSFSTLEWRVGPDMPRNVQYSGVAQLDDTILVMGGHSGRDTPMWDIVYKFDVDNYEWEELPQRLATPKINMEAMPVPEELVTCL